MQEWLYRASNAKADPDKTREFAEQYGFICRSAFADAAQSQMIANVAKVDFGDLIHLYFVDETGGRSLGAFQIVGPHRHPNPEFFSAGITKTKLRRVAQGPLRERLQENDSGYTPDPRLNEFCGWPVVPVEHNSPSYVRELFPGRNTLLPR